MDTKSTVSQASVVKAVDEAHPGHGDLVNKIVAAGAKAGVPPNAIWQQILAALVANVGPALVTALQALLASLLKPTA